MKTIRIASSVVLAVCLLGGSARADQQLLANQQANGFRYFGLLQPLQLTEPFRLGDLPASCSGIQTDGSRNATCVTPLSISDPFAIVSNTLTLKFDGTLHIVGGQLSVVSAAPTGAATNDLGGSYPGPTVLAAEFGAQRLTFATTPDGSLLKRLGTTVAPAVDGTDFLSPSTGLLDPGATGYVLRTSLGHTSASATIPTSVFSGTLLAPQFPALTGPVTTSAGSLATALNLGAGGISGTLQAAQAPPYVGAITTSAGSLTTAFGLQGPFSLFGVAGGSMAVPAPISATVPLTVPTFNATGTAVDWEPITPATAPGLVAGWPVANVRWYCVDPAGSDSNAGFSDSSESACGSAAIKTLAKLDAILPPGGGDNRKIKVTVNQGTYTDPPTFLSKLFGYNSPAVVATGTVSTCGATAFAGNAADAVCLGSVIATGMNAGGYNPTAGGTLYVIPLQLNGGGASLLPAEPGIPLGYRIRFSSTTATAGLRNFATVISKVTSSQIEVGNPLPVPYSTSDVFYIEMPGVTVPRITPNIPIGLNGGSGLNVAGINLGTSGNNSIVGGGIDHIAFSVSPAGLIQRTGWLFLSIQYSDPTLGIVQVGSPVTNGAVACTGCNALEIDGGYASGVSLLNTNEFDVDYGAVFGGIDIEGVIPSHIGNLGGVPSATTRACRIISTITSSDGFTAGLIAGDGTNVRLGRVEFSGQGSSPGIKLLNGSSMTSPFSGSSGTTGGAGVGLDLTSAVGATVLMPATPGVTGAADVKLANGTTISWATLAAAGRYTDTAGNQIISGASGTTLAGGALTVPALVGPGFVKATNSAGLFGVDTTTYLSSAFYQTVDEAGTPLTQRNVLNFDGTVVASDSSSPARTNVGLPNVGPGAGTYGGAGVASIVLDGQGRVTAATAKTYLADPGTTGFISKFAIPPNNTVARTFTSTGATLTVTNGDGVAGNPNFDVATHGVAYANIQQGSGLSVLGVTGASTANLADIVATGGTQCLQTNSGGTAVVWAACPSSGGGGSVTNVSGTSGQVTVVNNTTTPVISLVAKGAGAGAYGGSGIAGFSLDGFGAVTSVTPATYLTSTGTTPGTYNNLTVAGSGLITGASVTSWMTANDVMVSGGPAALPVGFSTFTYDGVNFAVNPGSGAGTMLFGVGGGVVMSMALGQVLLNAATVDVTALAAGGMVKANASTGQLAIATPGAAGDYVPGSAMGKVWTDATDAGANAPNYLYPKLTSFTNSISFSPTGSGDGQVTLDVVPSGLAGKTPQTMFWSWNLQSTQAVSAGVMFEGGMNTTVGGVNSGYPAPQSFSHVTITMNVLNNNCTGSGTLIWQLNVLKNGSGLVNIPVSCGTTGLVTTGSIAFPASAGDLIEAVYDGTLFGTAAGPQVTAFTTMRFDP